MNRIPLYNSCIMQHYHHSPYRKKLENPTIVSTAEIAACGDTITVSLRIENTIIRDYGFEGSGCILSQACASLLADLLLGQTIKKAREITESDIVTLCQLTDIGPTRFHCVTLALTAVQQGIENYAG